MKSYEVPLRNIVGLFGLFPHIMKKPADLCTAWFSAFRLWACSGNRINLKGTCVSALLYGSTGEVNLGQYSSQIWAAWHYSYSTLCLPDNADFIEPAANNCSQQCILGWKSLHIPIPLAISGFELQPRIPLPAASLIKSECWIRLVR